MVPPFSPSFEHTHMYTCDSSEVSYHATFLVDNARLCTNKYTPDGNIDQAPNRNLNVDKLLQITVNFDADVQNDEPKFVLQ